MAANICWCTPLGKLTLRQTLLFGILGALTFAGKYVMSGLPNLEPVSLMVLVFGSVFGWKALYPIAVYVAMELLFYGIGTWNIMYLYIWFVLAFGAHCIRDMRHPIGWALLSGSFGLAFGALCMPVDMVIGGMEFAVSKWISGIPFDIVHCIGNVVMAGVLFLPLQKLTRKLYGQIDK